ncbi:TPA: hypothetical protein ACT9K7_003234 [Legionella pneumophila]|uniref:hypothetical protein n=1 Tax=Legionella pneumophila TaxID=446 RepID=UPI001A2134F5|nr:hypothetical protein [Legionella pneumophila]
MGIKIAVWGVGSLINPVVFKSNEDLAKSDNPADFIIANKPFLKLTLDILHQNNITSVIGSQRIQRNEDDKVYGKYIKNIYMGLDRIFGKKRPYLREVDEIFQKVNSDGIIFIDDSDEYNQSLKQAGQIFVNVSREAKPGSVDGNAFLYETLLRTIPSSKIHEAIKNSKESGTVKKEFKKQLLTFQLDNLDKVKLWQQQILSEENILSVESSKKTQLGSEEEALKQVLEGVRYLILNTRWDIGYFGGLKVIDRETGIKNTVPKGMGKILQEIDKVQNGDSTWNKASENIEEILKKSAEENEHGFFNRRGETTQIFYEKSKKILSDLRSKPEVVVKQLSISPEKDDLGIVISEPEENTSSKNTALEQPVAVKVKNSLGGISSDKLFISESGYAYNVDDIIKNFRKLDGPVIFVDYLNPDSQESTIHFTTNDIQQLLDFPSIKEAVYKLCSPKDQQEDRLIELAELANNIPQEVLDAMYEVHKIGVAIPFQKRANESEYSVLMSPSMIALNEAVNKMTPAEKLSLKLFMDIMPYNYEIMRSVSRTPPTGPSMLEEDLRKQLNEGKCGNGFAEAMKVLPDIIRSFQEIQKVSEQGYFTQSKITP